MDKSQRGYVTEKSTGPKTLPVDKPGGLEALTNVLKDAIGTFIGYTLTY
jgi:hypothetical protein